MFIVSKALGHPSLTALTPSAEPSMERCCKLSNPSTCRALHQHPLVTFPAGQLGYSKSISNEKPLSHKPEAPSFPSRSSAQLPRLHLSSSPPVTRDNVFFPDTLCYSEIEDSVNAELLSSNYNTQNTVSLWDWCCRMREHSTGTQS